MNTANKVYKSFRGAQKACRINGEKQIVAVGFGSWRVFILSDSPAMDQVSVLSPSGSTLGNISVSKLAASGNLN